VKIAVAGGTGFIGEPLVRTLSGRGEVIVLSRNPDRVRVGRAVQWDPSSTQGPWRSEVADADVVINLAGENIGSGRWTAAKKKRMVESRVQSTRALVDIVRDHRRGNRILINASAVGYYGSRGDELLDENSPPGSDFLSNLCKEWEATARPAEDSARLAILRFGVVLGRDGGALQKMLLPFRLLVGGPIGPGDQWMSWIDRSDVVRLVGWVIDEAGARGVYNATSPEPVRNREFTTALGSVLRRPSFLPAPAPALRLVLGEMADAMLLASQRAVPHRLQEKRFEFKYPQIRSCLEHALR
jgi:uncharacterized protein (TIGR01777 family)